MAQTRFARIRDGVRELSDRLLPPDAAARMSRGELEKLRGGMVASLVLATTSLLFLPFALAMPRPALTHIAHVISIFVYVFGAVGPRFFRMPKSTALVLGIWPALALSVTMKTDPAGFMRYIVLTPLLAALFGGPRLVFVAVGIATFEMLVIGGPLTTKVSTAELQARVEVIFMSIGIGAFGLVYESLRARAERERDASEAARLALVREQATSEEAQRAQARLVHHQSLRADIGAALADTAPLVTCLQRCCEAMARHLDAASARLWLLDPITGVPEQVASAGRLPPAPPAGASPPVSGGAVFVSRMKRAYLSPEPGTDVHLAGEAWIREAGPLAYVGHPLAVGDNVVGVLELFTPEPLPEDTHAVLGTAADTLAHGVERKRAEQALATRASELARSNAELEQFAYVASHDLQEPLRMVASYTQLLARRYRGKLDPDADEFIAFVTEGVTRMKQLIQDLLTFSRVGTQGKPLAPVDAAESLEGALQHLHPTLEETGAQVTHDPLPTVLADDGQLVQLFQNLIANGIKFRRPGEPPRIHVSAQRLNGGTWELSVKDNGIGIAPEYFERIFVLFQRLHTRDEYPGTGIGLSICKKIAERHGGRIRVDSKPGEGATFFFTLKPAELKEKGARPA